MKLISRLLIVLIILNILLAISTIFLPNWVIYQIDHLFEQNIATERLLPPTTNHPIDGITIRGKPEVTIEKEAVEKN